MSGEMAFSYFIARIAPRRMSPSSSPETSRTWNSAGSAGRMATVGGGNYSDLAAQVPMHWLMSKAGLHGLAFRREIEVEPGAYSAELYHSFVAADIPDVLQRVLLQHGDRYYRPMIGLRSRGRLRSSTPSR